MDRGILVVPLLIGDVSMAFPADLPPGLAALSRHNAGNCFIGS
ncbi:MAG: hypothetical protein AAF191_01760 [Verrucomicrobiota bacterium]